MDQQTMIVVIAAIVIVAFIIILVKRAGSGRIRLPGGIEAEVKGEQPGAAIRRTELEGEHNSARASGPGAVIEDSRAKGKGNDFKVS